MPRLKPPKHSTLTTARVEEAFRGREQFERRPLTPIPDVPLAAHGRLFREAAPLGRPSASGRPTATRSRPPQVAASA